MILLFIVLIPILGVIAVLSGISSFYVSRIVAFLELFLAIALLVLFDLSRVTELGYFESYQYIFSYEVLDVPRINLAFGADGLSILMVLMSAVVFLLAIFSINSEDVGKAKSLIISSLLIFSGVLGAFLSTDLFFIFAFHELALVPTFLMIYKYGHEEKEEVAWLTLIFLVLGSMLLLAGIISLFTIFGGKSFDLLELSRFVQSGFSDEFGLEKPSILGQEWTFLILVLGFLVLIGFFPFHTWAIKAYSSAPSCIAILHSGVLKKFGFYGIIKVAVFLLPDGFERWKSFLYILLIFNLVYVGYLTIARRNMHDMIASSSVMHMGYIFLGIIIGGISILGSVILIVAHGMVIAVLFYLTGYMRRQVGSIDYDFYSGLGNKWKLIMFFTTISFFASMGLPGFGNFVGEFTIFLGAFAGYTIGEGFDLKMWVVIVAIISLLITSIYSLRALYNVFSGKLKSAVELTDISVRKLGVVLFTVFILLFVGIKPKFLLQFLSKKDFSSSFSVSKKTDSID